MARLLDVTVTTVLELDLGVVAVPLSVKVVRRDAAMVTIFDSKRCARDPLVHTCWNRNSLFSMLQPVIRINGDLMNDFAALAAIEDVEVACALMCERLDTVQAIIVPPQEGSSGHVDMDELELLRLLLRLMPRLHIIGWAHT